MTVYELSREQIIELKQAYITEKNNEINAGTSYDELANCDELISDKEIFLHYECYSFDKDDFFCTADI